MLATVHSNFIAACGLFRAGPGLELARLSASSAIAAFALSAMEHVSLAAAGRRESGAPSAVSDGATGARRTGWVRRAHSFRFSNP